MKEEEFKVNDDTRLTIGTGNYEQIKEYEEAEWVFQFDNDEPIVFAWTNEEGGPDSEIIIKLKANSQSSLFFTSHDFQKRLRIFCREMSDSTRKNLKIS
jgi:hypothetical protein